jgi:HprK-related kinase A
VRHATSLRIGPIGFRIGSDWRGPIAALDDLYRDYPKPEVPDFNVHLFAARPWRRVVRPSVHIGGDFVIPDAAPLPLAQGLLAAEMGMNLQMALGQRRYLLLHASAVERAGRAVLMTGISGAGKSTLAALLMARGWRMMGDEFVLIDPVSGLAYGFPRLISLKNEAIGVAERAVPEGRFGPVLRGTPKGTIRHLLPDARAIAAMETPAEPVAILFPRFGFEAAERTVLPSEAFVRLTQSSTNYVPLAERGFDALTRLVRNVPARAIDYPDAETAIVQGFSAAEWTALFAVARAEQLAGTLACRVDGLAMPDDARRIVADALASAEQGRAAALWEAEMARRALAPTGMPVVLLKGTAFAAAGLKAARGRAIGDLDILVPRDRIEEAETALIAAGWEWVKPDPYDDAYYRQWMHELPPLIHRERDRMIDVHHTILPLTARVRPDAAGLIAESVALPNGLRMLSPNDMLCHAAAHLFADGDLAGGMRNLWDIHCLIEEFGVEGLEERAAHHGLAGAMSRAARLVKALYATEARYGTGGWGDNLYIRRLTARDDWGRQTRKVTRLAFYIRSHWLRMPPAMLARHLWTKYRKGYRPV